MSFQIIEILDSQPQGISAKISHEGHELIAMIPNPGMGDLIAGQSLEAEIGYDEIRDWKVTSDFDPAKSGIWQEQNGIHLRGRIHSLLDFGDGKTIVDVFMQNGGEVFRVDLEAIEDAALESDSGLEITVGKLYIYPREIRE